MNFGSAYQKNKIENKNLFDKDIYKLKLLNFAII